jgi:hypothetical protein
VPHEIGSWRAINLHSGLNNRHFGPTARDSSHCRIWRTFARMGTGAESVLLRRSAKKLPRCNSLEAKVTATSHDLSGSTLICGARTTRNAFVVGLVPSQPCDRLTFWSSSSKHYILIWAMRFDCCRTPQTRRGTNPWSRCPVSRQAHCAKPASASAADDQPPSWVPLIGRRTARGALLWSSSCSLFDANSDRLSVSLARHTRPYRSNSSTEDRGAGKRSA